MAKELQALRSQRQEDVSNSHDDSPAPESTGQSSDNAAEHPGIATLDFSEVTQDYFQLDEFAIDRDTVIQIFQV